MTSAELFCATGEALYGRNWRTQLGDTLSISEKQIRRWAHGEYEIPQHIWDSLWCLTIDQRNHLAKLAKSISNLT
jgi:hypothetical protein